MIKISHCSIFKGNNKGNIEKRNSFKNSIEERIHGICKKNFKLTLKKIKIQEGKSQLQRSSVREQSGCCVQGGLSLLHVATENPRANIMNPCRASDALQVVSRRVKRTCPHVRMLMPKHKYTRCALPRFSLVPPRPIVENDTFRNWNVGLYAVA